MAASGSWTACSLDMGLQVRPCRRTGEFVIHQQRLRCRLQNGFEATLAVVAWATPSREKLPALTRPVSRPSAVGASVEENEDAVEDELFMEMQVIRNGQSG